MEVAPIKIQLNTSTDDEYDATTHEEEKPSCPKPATYTWSSHSPDDDIAKQDPAIVASSVSRESLAKLERTAAAPELSGDGTYIHPNEVKVSQGQPPAEPCLVYDLSELGGHLPAVSEIGATAASEESQSADASDQEDTLTNHSLDNLSETSHEDQQDGMSLPSMVISPSGLLTVLLRENIAVEMTLDRAIRLVNNPHSAVVATNNDGTSSCIHHPAARVFQDGEVTDADMFWSRKIRMSDESLLFAHGDSCFQLANNSQISVAEADQFRDLTNDMTVTILFSSSSYGPHLRNRYEEIVSNATFRNYRDGTISVKINGIRINQRVNGDVNIAAGSKHLHASAETGAMSVQTHCVHMAIQVNWTIQVTQGPSQMKASLTGLTLTDGYQECGFDENHQVFMRPASSKKPVVARTTNPHDINRWSYDVFYQQRHRNHRQQLHHHNHKPAGHYSGYNRNHVPTRPRSNNNWQPRRDTRALRNLQRIQTLTQLTGTSPVTLKPALSSSAVGASPSLNPRSVSMSAQSETAVSDKINNGTQVVPSEVVN